MKSSTLLNGGPIARLVRFSAVNGAMQRSPLTVVVVGPIVKELAPPLAEDGVPSSAGVPLLSAYACAARATSEPFAVNVIVELAVGVIAENDSTQKIGVVLASQAGDPMAVQVLDGLLESDGVVPDA